jgi:ClpP class serine protease
LIIILLQPALNRWLVAGARRRALERLARKRDATVITLIHRQETVSFLGIPLMRHIDIDDAESVLRAIRETPASRPISVTTPSTAEPAPTPPPTPPPSPR